VTSNFLNVSCTFSSILIGWLVAALTICAQETQSQPRASKAIVLSNETTIDSALDRLRIDLVAAITEGANPSEITGLIQRHGQMDAALSAEIEQIQEKLALTTQSKFNSELETEREELRRRQSLLWLARVELASLTPEMFAAGSRDGIALAVRAIQIIREALASFPSEGEVRNELTRLLSEAQLRSGDPDAAIRTLSQNAQRSGDDNEQRKRELVVDTADELAFVIRVDLAKQRWQAASEKLQQFYGEQPITAPRSTTMDMVRLQYLIANPTETSHLRDVGQWLDAIQKRNGKTARRHAETLLSRERLPDPQPDRAAASKNPAIESTVDPRVLRADARYYLRVGQTLTAAITLARAAADDPDASRSIESAIQSAAILQELSKQSAAAELLQRIAARHQQHELAPTLMLQAAALINDAAGDHESASTILAELMNKWPTSAAALTARTTLIQATVARGQHVEAAVLATQMPAEHWSSLSAQTCRALWQRAIIPTNSFVSPCHWNDANCHRQQLAERQSRLVQMRRAFAAAATHPLAMQTQYACTILLDSLPTDSPHGNPLRIAASEVTDPFLKNIAHRRLGLENQTTAQESATDIASDVATAAIWRLHEDSLNNSVLNRSIGTYLLKLNSDRDIVGPQTQIVWLIWSGQTERAIRDMRATLKTSEQPADLIAAAASALAASTNTSDLRAASALWQELATGIPSEQASHQQAQVESIVCQWRAGDRAEARAAAALMLLTNPPQQSSLRARLQELAK
jgi:tetratricopeptide (TPR) repeat protein